MPEKYFRKEKRSTMDLQELIESVNSIENELKTMFGDD